ncbi:hypothetical protein L917_02934 [Phytophthora nicotianae]|uniref:Uncharacterized protein n=1 Tax=Phytophthora nicotianae TaxID=4792 RepID=W2FZM8_PHYNI|nr:hypothetical protein L915_17895 [Phytophthora nicotianae]ETM00331.1 hypothetical protein L917_02934 [Phytophthora nicotianae]
MVLLSYLQKPNLHAKTTIKSRQRRIHIKTREQHHVYVVRRPHQAS